MIENDRRTASPFGLGEVETSNRSMLRIALATMIGGAIEAFDFLTYGMATAVVFNKLFFPTPDARARQLAAFGAFAAGFLRGLWVGSSSAISAIVSAAREC